MIYSLLFTAHALADLKKLDRQVSKKVVEKLEYYCDTPNPMRYAESLSDPFAGLYRFRIGDYRVFFETNRAGIVTVLMILKVRYRREAYR